MTHTNQGEREREMTHTNQGEREREREREVTIKCSPMVVGQLVRLPNGDWEVMG